MTLVDAFLRDHGEELDAAGLGLAEGWSTLIVTPWFQSSRHVIELVHSRHDRRMKVVVKMPRRPGDDAGIQREGVALRRLADLAPTAAARAPRVLALTTYGGQSLLAETAVEGQLLGPELVRSDLARAVREGIALVRTLPITSNTREDEQWFERLFEAPMRRALELVPRWGPLQALIGQSLAQLAPLRHRRLPLMFEHGDLTHPNLVLTPSGKLAAIDWERSEERGLPLHDLCFVLRHIAESRAGIFDRTRRMEIFDQSFRREGWVMDALRSEGTRLSVDVELIPALVLASWARSSLTLVQRLWSEAAVEGGPQGRGVTDQSEVAKSFERNRDFALWRRAAQHPSHMDAA